MRTSVLFLLVLISGSGDNAGTAARDSAKPAEKLDVVDVMPAFWKVMDAQPAAVPAARARGFQREVIDAYPGLYGPVVPADAAFDAAAYLEQLGTFLPTMRDLDHRTRAQIDSSLGILRARFGPLSDMTIYVAPSLFTSNGQVRVVDGRPVVLFGVDVQAYAEQELLPKSSRYDLRAYVAHELVHAHHYGMNAAMRAAANTLFDEKNPAPLYLNLWIEGLATCVSMSMDGDGSVERALMSARIAAELPPVLPALAREMSGKLDARSLEATRDYFWLGGERKDIPPRSAYGVGALVAADVLARRGLGASLLLAGDDLRAEVANALAKYQQPVAVDWSSICEAGRFRE